MPHRLSQATVALLIGLSACTTADGPDAAPSPDVTTAASATPSTTAEAAPVPVFPAGPDLEPGATVCDLYSSFAPIGTIAPAQLNETSGLVASRRYPDVLWAHNDSGDSAAVHALDTTGGDLGRFRLNNATALDWEDIAIGPGPDPNRDYLYLGDIGDNLLIRGRVSVYRIPEPEPGRPGDLVEEVERFDLSYGERSFNAEALLVDPATGDLLIVTKRDDAGRAFVLVAPQHELSNGSVTRLQPVAVLELGQDARVTAADITSDGAVIALRGYDEVWMWVRQDLGFSETFARDPCLAVAPEEPGGGEALAFVTGTLDYLTTSEGALAPINYVPAGS